MWSMGFYSRVLTRKWRENFRRMIDVHTRYGSGGLTMLSRITRFVDLLQRFNVSPTFPTPAVILKKYPQFFKHLIEEGVELAVHGYCHVDYERFSLDRAVQELEKAYSIFHAFGVFSCGFRFPFLRKNFPIMEKLGEIGYGWDSSIARYWNVVPMKAVDKKRRPFTRILSTYQALPAEKTGNLPYWIDQTLEIPVSLPDDEMLLDRMGNRDPQFLLNVWSQILKQVRDRREIFVLQAHPERYDFFYIALSHLLQEAKAYGDVWITHLGEIANWWRERSNAQFKIEKFKKDHWKVIPLNSNRFALLCVSNGTCSEIPLYSKQKSSYWVVQSSKRPCLGVHPDTAFPVFQWLKQEGILYEMSTENFQYEIFLHEPNPNFSFSELSKKVFASNHYILKLGEWPAPFQSALAVSGDIDYMDIWGFWSKLYAS